MEAKEEGQAAISRIIEIRQFFPKATLTAKKDYLQQYKDSMRKLIAYLRVEENQIYANELKQRLPGLNDELHRMKAEINEEEEATNAKQSVSQSQKPTEKDTHSGKQDKSMMKNEASELQEALSEAIVREKPNIKWEDVAGLDQAKKVLQEAVILPIKFPEVFVGQRTPWKGILLYGPPGTGKTFLAKACATQMQGGTFFSVSSSDLMSKYVGQSEKTLKALFNLARKERPSIIFIDEIDSIAGERSSEENQVSRRVKTEFLIQMQGVGNDCKDVLVLGATNLPWALDSAVRRRFQKRVYIPLPDIKGRIAMVKRVVEKNNIQMTHDQLMEISGMLEGYSGSDISNMANDALMAPVRMLDKVTRWLQVNDQGKVKYAPVTPHSKPDPNGKYFQGNMQQLKDKGYTIYLATKYQDFVDALKNSKPSVSQEDLGRYIQFTKTFGMDG